jgi:hypothetical protein
MRRLSDCRAEVEGEHSEWAEASAVGEISNSHARRTMTGLFEQPPWFAGRWEDLIRDPVQSISTAPPALLQVASSGNREARRACREYYNATPVWLLISEHGTLSYG